MLQRLFLGRQKREKKAKRDTTLDLMVGEIEHMVGIVTCASPFYFDILVLRTDPAILVREWAFDAHDEWLSAFIG